MNKVEILAPVGSMEALIAAVRCGADAVYLGQKNFSARKNSQNFDEKELCEAVAYAHKAGVKVHQALNILVFDHEIESLKQCIKSACKAGIDAFIVQDLGVLSIVKTLAPNVPVHASTQLAVHSLNGVKEAQKLGFSRVVLARELSKEEILYIRKNTSIELEVFVHGAHCMSISGQCYMSAVFGGKSGNRGQCAQPCRLPFTVGNENKYALSLKDLSLIERLPELRDMGVDSFKIEGRMKRPEYVAAAVTSCKKALNSEIPDLKTLEAIFSRSGFTSGYFDSKIDSDMFGFRKKENVISANNVLKPLHNLYHKQTPLVPICMKFTMKNGFPIKLEITDTDNNVVFIEGKIPEKAKNLAIDKESCEKFFSKLGRTPYFLKKFTADIEGPLFLPSADFNALRREGIALLDKLREKNNVTFLDVPLDEIKTIKTKNPPALWGKFSNFSQIPDNTDSLEKIILPLNEVLNNKDKLSLLASKIIVSPPRFAFKTEKSLKEKLKTVKDYGFSSLFCDNLSHIHIGRELSFTLFGGPFLNLTNSYSLNAAKEMGINYATISIENNIDWILNLKTPIPTGILGYGYIPLMSVRNCPVKAQKGCKECNKKGYLTDRMGFSFPVKCDEETSFIYNSLPLSVSERQKEFKNISFFLLDFTIEKKDEIKKIINNFKTHEKLSENHTKGLYYRFVE